MYWGGLLTPVDTIPLLAKIGQEKRLVLGRARGIYSGQSGFGTYFCPNTLVSPISVTHVFIYRRCYIMLAIDSVVNQSEYRKKRVIACKMPRRTFVSFL
jgi:hypothetical protein